MTIFTPIHPVLFVQEVGKTGGHRLLGLLTLLFCVGKTDN